VSWPKSRNRPSMRADRGECQGAGAIHGPRHRAERTPTFRRLVDAVAGRTTVARALRCASSRAAGTFVLGQISRLG
jgi:hypothetical protein